MAARPRLHYCFSLYTSYPQAKIFGYIYEIGDIGDKIGVKIEVRLHDIANTREMCHGSGF